MGFFFVCLVQLPVFESYSGVLTLNLSAGRQATSAGVLPSLDFPQCWSQWCLKFSQVIVYS